MSDLLSKPIVQAGAAILLPNIGGWASGLITRQVRKYFTQNESQIDNYDNNIQHIKTWYEQLNKPKLRPPNYVFPIAWTTLYSSMGYASYLVWKNGGGFGGAARFPLMLYGAQFALNMAWTPLFFGMHELKWVS